MTLSPARRTIAHLVVAFVSAFLSALLAGAELVHGPLDRKALVAAVAGAAGSAAVAAFRKVFPAEAATVTHVITEMSPQQKLQLVDEIRRALLSQARSTSVASPAATGGVITRAAAPVVGEKGPETVVPAPTAPAEPTGAAPAPTGTDSAPGATPTA